MTTRDPTTAYAYSIVQGERPAGPSLVHACQRHLDDLEGQSTSRVFDAKAANSAAKFFRSNLRFVKGVSAGQPFRLLPWQHFFVGSIYGWKVKRPHPVTQQPIWVRRFRRAYLRTGKGSGKSPLVAGMALAHLSVDREQLAEVYVAARTFAQTAPLFVQAAEMIRQTRLSEQFTVLGGNTPSRIIHNQNRGRFERVSSDSMGEGVSGPNASMTIIDEYHEAANDSMLEFLSMGAKDRLQPMTIILTNAGASRQSCCYVEDQIAKSVAAGLSVRDDYFSFIADTDDRYDPFEDEDCWEQANPSMPHTPTLEYIRSEVASTEGNPSKRALVDRLNFGRWTEALNPWLEESRFNACVVDDDEWTPPADAPRYLGLDLSRKADLTAAADVAVETHQDGTKTYWLDVQCWMPKDGIVQRAREDNVPYLRWVEDGHIFATPGPIIDFEYVVGWLRGRLATDRVQACVYDHWRIDELQRILDDHGIPWCNRVEKRKSGMLYMVRHAQGFTGAPANAPATTRRDARPKPRLWMPRSIDQFETAVLSRKVKMRDNPVFRWACFGCEVMADAQNNRALKKSTSESKIDPLVAAVMAVGAASELRAQASSLAALYKEMKERGLSSVSRTT